MRAISNSLVPPPELSWQQRIDAAATKHELCDVLTEFCREPVPWGLEEMPAERIRSREDIEDLIRLLEDAVMAVRPGLQRYAINRARDAFAFASLAYRRLSMAGTEA